MAVALDAAGKGQLDQGDLDRANGEAGGPRQLIDVDGGRAEGGQQPFAVR